MFNKDQWYNLKPLNGYIGLTDQEGKFVSGITKTVVRSEVGTVTTAEIELCVNVNSEFELQKMLLVEQKGYNLLLEELEEYKQVRKALNISIWDNEDGTKEVYYNKSKEPTIIQKFKKLFT